MQSSPGKERLGAISNRIGVALSEYSSQIAEAGVDALGLLNPALIALNSALPYASAIEKAVVKHVLVKTGEQLKKRDKTLEQLRDEITKLLKPLNNNIVVTIDDVDRLPGEEIRALFKLVNLLASFPHMTFLLAYDQDVVVKALSEVQGIDGGAYLEKIVQLPIDLPPASKDILRKLVAGVLEPYVNAFNLDLYETEIIAQKNESFYTPEGYRAIKQILLAYPKEAERAVKNERARYNLAAQAMTEVMQQLLSAATQAESWEDMKDAKAAYDAAEAELKEARAELVKKRNAAARPLIQPTADAILEEFSAGIDIDTLIKRYSTDTNEANTTGGGYPFHPDSKNWTEEFSAAASKLRKPGEISQPVFSDLGIHILYYASDIPGGEHELTAQEEEILTASATDYYQGLELQKLIAEWKPDYEIETHPELMDE